MKTMDLTKAVATMEGELMSRPEILRVALFPGPTWTVQDLVGICNSARRVREESWEPAPTCALLSEPPAVLVGNDG